MLVPVLSLCVSRSFFHRGEKSKQHMLSTWEQLVRVSSGMPEAGLQINHLPG